MSAGQAAQLQKSMFGKTADQMRDEALAKRMSSKQNDSQSSQGGSSGSSGGGGGGGGPKNALYTFADHNSGSKYPSWKDGKPNLLTYLDALDSSSPIVGSQFELVWSRWPRTIFFAKNITVPGIEVNTLEINHAGFVIPIPTHVAYGTNEITMTILADKEGFHYYDMRNMVLQSAHPFVAGDTKSMIGSFENISDEDILDIRLRNSPEDVTHHHWIIHNFHPIRIGDVELSHDSSNFVEFELAGNFTHIDYDCGYNDGPNPFKPSGDSSGGSGGEDNNGDPEDGFGPTDDEGGEGGGGDQNGEQGDEGMDNTEQGDDLPEDWEYMNENDKKAYNMMKDGMSAEEAQNAIKEELKQSDPSLSEDDLEAQSLAAVQNATAAQNTQENKAAPPNNVDTKLNESEQGQFQQEFSNSQPAPPESSSSQPEQPSQPQPE